MAELTPCLFSERLVLEVCLAKWWANIGSVEVSISVNFHGLQLDQREVSLHGGDAITRLEVSSRISNEEVSLSCQQHSIRHVD